MTISQKPPLRLRHELKYPISGQDACILSAQLRKLFQHDANAGPEGTYMVRSLYFDTPYDKALRQKLDGVDRREKFRLRYYGADTSCIRLEKKCKINGLCSKYSAKLTAAQVRQLLAGEVDFLLREEHPLLLEFYSKLRGQQLAPKTIVTYMREAFVYPPGNVRITLDSGLHTGLFSLDFLSPQRYQAPASGGITILEVKYDAFLPEVVSMAVQLLGRQASAYSKYAQCRSFD